MKTIGFLLLIVAALMLRPATTWADGICGPNGFPNGDGRCVTFSGGSASLQTTQVPASTTMSVPGFNPALGMLDEVDCLNCSQSAGGGTASVTVTVTNPSPFQDPFEFFGGLIRLELGPPSSPGWITGVDQMFCSFGPLDPGASQTTDCVDAGIELGDGLPLVSPQNLADFVTAGNVIFPVSFDSVSFNDFSDTIAFDSANMTVDVGLAYIYTPATVPEPASAVLLITAVLILGPLLWKRKNGSPEGKPWPSTD